MYVVILGDTVISEPFSTEEEARQWLHHLSSDFIEDFTDKEDIDVTGPEVWTLGEWNSYVIGL
ncbi:unknown [Lactobacillus phage Lb338-1]|uniref:Uncharacterized protein n=1 Tax=Lactobacillus phage Lb338-1 TaxID=2892342 RepID=C1KFH2_9CAUD|nr:hypothetical protein lb338_phage_62 [Lactobacillus phage Lb338-1]ACO36983.1 unknown [Lactobacillus phage Lb338-1]